MESMPQDTKKVFRKCGTCSRTFFFLLNREFGYLIDDEERAADPLAGGIMQKGHQCGMLWGSALAVGAEAYRRSEDPEQAIGLAIAATQELVESFSGTTNTVDCRDVTGTDFSKPLQMARYMLFRAKNCFNLAEQWAPDAIRAARQGLDQAPVELPQPAVSCASEVVRRMGGSAEERAMVAGLAGGIGLGGHGCGALGAAIWKRSLDWAREHPGKSPYSNPYAKKTFNAFLEATGGEMLCHKLCGRRFENMDEHAEYIKDGGCEELMEVLAHS